MNSFNLILPYFKQHKLQIIIGLASLIFVDILQLSIPRVVKHTIDSLTLFDIELSKLFEYSLIIVTLGLFIAIFRYIWRRCLIGLSRFIERELRDKLFKHIQTLSPSFFSKTKTGDLMAHATNDLNHIRMATGMGLVALTDGIFLGTSSIIFMLYINFELTLFAIIPMPLIIVVAMVMSKKMHKIYQETQAVFSVLTEKVREFFSGIRVVKSYQIENTSMASVNSISKEYVKKSLVLTAMTGTLFPLMMLISNISIAIVLYKGGQLTIQNIITPGDFVAFMSYLGLLVWPMMAVGWVTNLIQRGRASLDRLNIIFETVPDISNSENPFKTDRIKNGIELKNVSFNYPQTCVETLSDVSLIIETGKITGFAGPPGSGKTTLLNLIPRLFDISHGAINVDNRNIKDYDISFIRDQFSYMEQEPYMFSGSILDNITFGQDITDNDLEQILYKADLTETIKIFPDGIDTIIGEKGVILSGGQKQRVAFARALMKKNCILILDDPISQVDTRTGTNIINSIINSETVIISSHRFSALKKADIIYVIENGKITGKGTHNELVLNNIYYGRSYHMQTYLEEAL
jgi:ATP-binding cassette subfamily B protein